jgi:hypothetical protein
MRMALRVTIQFRFRPPHGLQALSDDLVSALGIRLAPLPSQFMGPRRGRPLA